LQLPTPTAVDGTNLELQCNECGAVVGVIQIDIPKELGRAVECLASGPLTEHPIDGFTIRDRLCLNQLNNFPSLITNCIQVIA
jgi:hypothetical protein